MCFLHLLSAGASFFWNFDVMKMWINHVSILQLFAFSCLTYFWFFMEMVDLGDPCDLMDDLRPNGMMMMTWPIFMVMISNQHEWDFRQWLHLGLTIQWPNLLCKPSHIKIWWWKPEKVMVKLVFVLGDRLTRLILTPSRLSRSLNRISETLDLWIWSKRKMPLNRKTNDKSKVGCHKTTHQSYKQRKTLNTVK